MRHIILILALLCASCSSSLPSIKPYKMDIQQGNVVTSKMMLQLRPGMTKSQVRFIMGTPLIQDSFHKDRWDYFYQMRKGGKIIEQRRVILEFDQDALLRVRGDVVPAGSGQDIAEPSPVSESGKAAKQPAEKKGLIDKLKFWKDDKDVEKPQAAPADLVNPQPATPKQVAPAKPAPAPVSPEAAQPAPAAPEESKPQESKPVVKPAEAVKPVGPAPEQAAPAPAAEPVPQQPVEAPALVEKSAPVAKPMVQPKEAAKPQATPKPTAKPEPAAEPEKDLPPEDEPGYFERMLEKIGF